MKAKRVMMLAPHTDDGEFGCGRTTAKFIEQGAEVFYTALSVCEQAVPYGFQQDELERELRQATAVMEIPKNNVLIHCYEVRHFPLNRQEILQDILDTKQVVKPDLVFMPCLTDIHQDHQVVAMEGLRAYKGTTIPSYEMPWNNISIQTSTFVTLEERHIEEKVAALACYKTQTFRHDANAEFIRSLAVTGRAQIGVPLAEVFELVRLVLKTDMSRVAFAGSKTTTAECIERLIRDGFSADLLVTLTPDLGARHDVAGYADLRPFAAQHGIAVYHPRSTPWMTTRTAEWWLESLTFGAFGMHGSHEPLPRGRGRSPLNWALAWGKTFLRTHLFSV